MHAEELRIAGQLFNDKQHSAVAQAVALARDILEARFFFQAEDGIRDYKMTGVQTCALPICSWSRCHANRSYPRPQIRRARPASHDSHKGEEVSEDEKASSIGKLMLEWKESNEKMGAIEAEFLRHSATLKSLSVLLARSRRVNGDRSALGDRS